MQAQSKAMHGTRSVFNLLFWLDYLHHVFTLRWYQTKQCAYNQFWTGSIALYQLLYARAV